MKTMNANTALDGHTTVIKMAERGGVPLIVLLPTWRFLNPETPPFDIVFLFLLFPNKIVERESVSTDMFLSGLFLIQ